MSNEIAKSVASYNNLTNLEKRNLFENVNIFRGICFSETEGIYRSFHDLYSWKQPDYLPVFTRPQKNTFVRSDYSFCKVTHELKKMNIHGGSVSFSSPFLSSESEYKHEKNKRTSSSRTEEHLLAQFIVRHGSFHIDFSQAKVSEEFVKAVIQALNMRKEKWMKCEDLVEVLNEWGYYVPHDFTLGGILYSEKTTNISEYSQAEAEKEDFSASFKANFDGIGGGAAYNNHSETEEANSSSSKHENTAICQIGGIPGTTNDYPSWAASLYDATFWDMAECSRLMPVLMLLLHSSDVEQGTNLLGQCLRLLDSCHSLPVIRQMQPYIALNSYANEIEAKLNPFS